MKLREIPSEIERLVAEYNSEEWNDAPVTDERRLQIEQALDDLDYTVEDKAAHYADLIAHYESDAETIKEEERRLASIRKRAEGAAEWLRRNLQGTLLTLNRRKIETDFWKFGFRRSESMVVRAEDAIPEVFMIPVPATFAPDNKAIKEALQEKFDKGKEFYGEFESEEIPGAVLIVKQNLQIK